MFLLQIINKKKIKKKRNIFQICKLIIFIKNFKSKLLFFKKFNQFQISLKKNSICYVVNIIFKKKDTIIYLTDIKGKLKIFKSVNLLKTVKKSKKKKINIFLQLLKFFILNISYLKNKPVALHFKKVKKYYINIIMNILEKILYIKIIKIYNFLIPHNGCRPKKLKRKKKNKNKI